MENKNYPTLEEEDSCGTFAAAEPALTYAHAGPTIQTPSYMHEDNVDFDRIPTGMFGFYTDDPEIFEQRVNEMEADLDEVEAGIEDPEKWIQVDDFWAAMKKEHTWL